VSVFFVFFSETTRPIGTKFGRNVLVVSMEKIFNVSTRITHDRHVFVQDPTNIIPAIQ
jgi:hypothetical protein